MATLATSLAYAVTGGAVSLCPQPNQAVLSPPVDAWVLPSDATNRIPKIIALSTAVYDAGPRMEAVMRGAVLLSTEHRYDL